MKPALAAAMYNYTQDDHKLILIKVVFIDVSSQAYFIWVCVLG